MLYFTFVSGKLKMFLKRSSNNVRHFSKLSTKKKVKPFHEIPGPKSLPVIGTLGNYLPVIGKYSFDKIHHNGIKKYKKYGPVVREEFVPGVNTIWLIKPDDFQEMYNAEGKYPSRRSHLALHKFRSERKHIYNTSGLLTTNGLEWYNLRSAIQKKLSRIQNIRRYVQATNDVMTEFCNHIDKLSTDNNLPACFLPYFSRLFLELVCLVVFDIRLHSFSNEQLQENSLSSLLMAAALDTNGSILTTDNGPQLWKYFDTPTYSKIKNAQLFMENVAIDFVTKKKLAFEKKERSIDETLSILEQLLESDDMDFKDIIVFACDVVLAGIDTTSNTTSFIFYHLSKNPEVQERLFQEIIQFLPEKNSPITVDIIENVKYTKNVIKEALRLNPVSIGVGRIIQEDAVFSDYFVPQGTCVITQNQIACRLEQYFEKPNDFLPERWVKDLSSYKPIHPYLVLPFGHGPRSCIARRLSEQNMTMIILKVIRQFKVFWRGVQYLDTKSLLINKPDGDVNLYFEKRKE